MTAPSSPASRGVPTVTFQMRTLDAEPYTRGVDIGPEQAPIVIEPIEAPVPVDPAPAVPATPAPVEEPVPG